tara:strand:- start:724 stop:825 length:102 start_codon:yes stop_codon:yes gene_type:complete
LALDEDIREQEAQKKEKNKNEAATKKSRGKSVF